MRELQRELARRRRAGRRMQGMQSTRAAVVVRIRADRALQHGRWEEMMCNNARATHSARTEHDAFLTGDGERKRVPSRRIDISRARADPRISAARLTVFALEAVQSWRKSPLFSRCPARGLNAIGRSVEGDQNAIRFAWFDDSSSSRGRLAEGSRERKLAGAIPPPTADISGIFSLSGSEVTITDIRNSIGI